MIVFVDDQPTGSRFGERRRQADYEVVQIVGKWLTLPGQEDRVGWFFGLNRWRSDRCSGEESRSEGSGEEGGDAKFGSREA